MTLNRFFKYLTIVMLSIVMTAFTMLTISAEDISFSITNLTIDANIEADGDVLFQDTYTYDVDFFNGAVVTVDPGESDLDEYRIGVKRAGDHEITYLKEDYTGLNGTYQVSREGAYTSFKIFYPLKNEIVDFVIEYRLNELVVNYQDTALFSRVIVPHKLEETVDVKAIIHLPSMVNDKNDFRVWGYGTPRGDIHPISQNGESYIDVTATRVSSNQFVEVLSLFPTSLTPNNKNVINQPIKEQVIAQQEKQVEADRRNYEQKRQWLGYATIGVVLLGVGMQVFAFSYYFRKRRQLNPTPAHIPEHVYTLPAEITPAVMATAVFRPSPTADDFSATILDLARKGYITIEEVKVKKRGIFKSGYDSTIRVSPKIEQSDAQMNQLEAHEKAVYDYLLEKGQSFTLNEIESKVKNNDQFRKRQNRLWTHFKNQAEVKGEKLRGTVPFEQMMSRGNFAIGMAVSIIGSIVTLVVFSDYLSTSTIVTLVLTAVISLIVGFIGFVLVEKRPIKTYEQDKMEKEWRSFKNMLDNIGNMNMREVASLPLWDEFLVYAVSLGVADKVLEAMNNQYGLDEIAELSMPANFYRDYYLITSLMRTSINDSIQSSAPSSSGSGGFKGDNSGGFGGGFSGGSFGGGGGGGSAGGF